MSSQPPSRKPRFVLSFGIPELTNVPSPSGSCYVKWRIRERSISTIKGKTKPSNIRDYRVVWGYYTQLLVKLSTNSRDNVLKDKILELSVYQSVHHLHHHHQPKLENGSHPSSAALRARKSLDSALRSSETHSDGHGLNKDSSAALIGKVEINLSEFVNFEEPKTNRYLLKDAKINAVLHVQIGMEAAEGNNENYNAPPIKYKGLANIFSSDSSSVPDSGSPASSHLGGSQKKSNSHASTNSRLYRQLAISNDPVISKLYERTFDISWDLRPGEYTIGESVDDVFNDGDGWAKNEDGVLLIDLQRQRVVDEHAREEETLNTRFGGINEFDVRGDIKGWQIRHR